jgi:hypothetical protein
MSAPGEFYHPDNYVVMAVDNIEDCPLVEFPLSALFDITTSTVVEDYLEVLHDHITQLLEDTTWLEEQSRLSLLCARFAVYHQRTYGELVSLRKPALQRLITQTLRNNSGVHDPIEVPVFIRFFMMPDNALPRLQQHSFNTRNLPVLSDRPSESRGALNVVSPFLPEDPTQSDALIDTPSGAAETGYNIDGSNRGGTDVGYRALMDENNCTSPAEVLVPRHLQRIDRAMTVDVTTTSPGDINVPSSDVIDCPFSPHCKCLEITVPPEACLNQAEQETPTLFCSPPECFSRCTTLFEPDMLMVAASTHASAAVLEHSSLVQATMPGKTWLPFSHRDKCETPTCIGSHPCCTINFMQASGELLLLQLERVDTTHTGSVSERVSPRVALAEVIQSLLLSGNAPDVPLMAGTATKASSWLVANATVGTLSNNGIATQMPIWPAVTLLSPPPPAEGSANEKAVLGTMPYVFAMAAEGNRLLLPINMRFQPVDRGRSFGTLLS